MTCIWRKRSAMLKMNQLTFKGMLGRELRPRLRRISLVALVLGFIVTGANAQGCGWQEPSYFFRGTPLGAVSSRPDVVDVFATDFSGCVYRVTWSPYSGGFWEWQPINYWLGYQEMGPSSPVTAISRSTDKIDVFATATANDSIETAAWDLTNEWHGWWPIGASAGICLGGAVPI
jgi:hypothetical protein